MPKLERKINLRMSEEEYQYLLSRGDNMSDYVRLLIKIDMKFNKEKALKIKKKSVNA